MTNELCSPTMARGKKGSKRLRPEDTSTTPSTADLSSTVGETIKEYFDNLICNLKTDYDNKINVIENKLCDFESKIGDLQTTVDRLESNLAEERRISERLRDENKEIKDSVQNIQSKQGGGLQYQRRNNIKIYGLKELKLGGRGETETDTIKHVIDFLNVRLGLRIQWQDICIAHRLGPIEENRYRSIIVKFVRRTTKLNILENRHRLKGSGIVIAEDLTPENNKLFWELRESFGKYNVWTRDCQIFVNTRDGPKLASQVNKRELLEFATHGPQESTPIQRHQRHRPAPRGRGRHAPHAPHAPHVPRFDDPVRPGTADRSISSAPFRFGRGRARSPRGRGWEFPTQPPPPGTDITPHAWGPPLRGFARGRGRFDDA